MQGNSKYHIKHILVHWIEPPMLPFPGRLFPLHHGGGRRVVLIFMKQRTACFTMCQDGDSGITDPSVDKTDSDGRSR